MVLMSPWAAARIAPSASASVEWRVVKQAHHRIAVLDRRHEEVARQAEMESDRLENPRARHLEGSIEFGKSLAKTFDLVGPEIGRHIRGKRVASRQLPSDVPEFLEIMDHGILGTLDAEGRVAARAAAAVNLVGHLGFGRQRKKRARQPFCAVDQILRNGVVSDHRESVFLEAAAELLGNLFERASDGNGSDFRHGYFLNRVETGRPVQRSSGLPMNRLPGRAGRVSR